MNCLVVGDIHLTHRRLKRSELLLSRLTETISSVKPNMVILLGDVFDEHDIVRNDCLTIFSEFLSANSHVKIVHILGNHEMNDSKTFLPRFHALAPFKNTPNYVAVDNPTHEFVDGTHVGYVPYCPPGTFHKATEMLSGKESLLFAHQEFKGCLMEAGLKSEHGDELPLCKVISGHIHGEHTVGDLVWYPGTPCQHRFSEDEEKFVYLIDIQNGSYKIVKPIDLQMPKFVTREVKIQDLSKFEIDPVNEYRIVIKDTPFNIIAFKKTKEYKKLAKQVKFKFIAEDHQEKTQRKLQTNTKSFSERFSDYVKERKLEKSYQFIFDKLP